MSILKEYFTLDDIKKLNREFYLPYAALGARTCYANNLKIEDLLSDKRVQGEKIQEFLLKLSKVRHFSVFSHTFTWIRFDTKEDARYVSSMLFKSIYGETCTAYWHGDEDEKSYYVGISLRHILETWNTEEEQREIINTFGEYKKYIEPLQLSDKTYVVYTDTRFGGWLVVFFQDISRVTTHQFVRHTKLNFSQRSDRYTNNIENSIVIPPSTQEDEVSSRLVINHDKLTRSIYASLLERGIKKEDARYILGEGNKSSLLVSGSFTDWYNFISLRTDKHAQWEIRSLATDVQDFLTDVITTIK